MELYRILGAQCLAVTSVDEIKKHIRGLIERGAGGYSVAINAEKIMMYSRNAQMREVIDNSLLPTPDGAGAVLGMKYLYRTKCIKLNLPRTIFELSEENGYSLLILGSTDEINERAVLKLKEKYPRINIVGRRDGYFKNESEVEELIAELRPMIVMVAMGSPKQELFSARMSSKFPSAIFIGCGGTLDALAGKVQSAPDLFRYNNLEWLYRLYQSPKRIKRQWILPFFLIKLLFTALIKKITGRNISL